MKPPAKESRIADLERRARCAGELLHWGSCRSHPLKRRKGDRLSLIAILDDATHEAWARFAVRNSTTENMRLLEQYLGARGRPVRVLTNQKQCFPVHSCFVKLIEGPAIDAPNAETHTSR